MEENVTSETTVTEKKDVQMPAAEAVPASFQRPLQSAILGEFLPLLRKLKAKEEKLVLF